MVSRPLTTPHGSLGVDVEVVLDRHAPKGTAFLVSPPDEDGKREFIQIVNIIKTSRLRRFWRFAIGSTPVPRWVVWIAVGCGWISFIHLAVKP